MQLRAVRRAVWLATHVWWWVQQAEYLRTVCDQAIGNAFRHFACLHPWLREERDSYSAEVHLYVISHLARLGYDRFFSADGSGDDFARWLWKKAISCFQNQAKREGRRRGHGSATGAPAEPRTQPPVGVETFAEAELLELITRLPGELRDVVGPLVEEGMTQRKIAGRLGISVGTVHDRLAEARRLLRQALAGGTEE